jgi:hypothetical protein
MPNLGLDHLIKSEGYLYKPGISIFSKKVKD